MSAWWRCLAGISLILLAGCQPISLRKTFPWVVGEDGRLDRPLKVVAFWTDSVLTQPGKIPVRGFGGRLMFYKDQEAKPLKVSGTLTVYAFDDSRGDDHVQPDRKYVFTPQQFAEHYSKGKLGHSYSVWLPWDEVGGERKRITLIVRFEPTQGGIVVSEPSQHILPGLEPAEARAGRRLRPRPGDEGTSGLSIRDTHETRRPETAEGQPSTRATGPGTYNSSVQGPYVKADERDPVWPAAYEEETEEPTPSKRLRPITIALPSHYSHSALYRSGSRQLSRQSAGAAVSYPGRTPAQRFEGPSQAQAEFLPQRLPQAAGSEEAASPPAENPGGPQARFGPRRSRPLGEPIARLERGRAPWPPRREEPQSAHQPQRSSQKAARETP